MRRAWRRCRANAAPNRNSLFDGGADGLDVVRRILNEAGRHLTPEGGLLCEIGRWPRAARGRLPQLPLLWLDTEDSQGEVFWIGAADLS